MLVVNVRVQAQQKGESRVDKLVRGHGGSHEEHDRACHEAIQAAVSQKHKINPYSHHYVNDVMQLQPLRHDVEDECALFEYVSTEDRHELISFMAVAQSHDSDRKSVVEGKSVELGGGRRRQKKKRQRMKVERGTK